MIPSHVKAHTEISSRISGLVHADAPMDSATLELSIGRRRLGNRATSYFVLRGVADSPSVCSDHHPRLGPGRREHPPQQRFGRVLIVPSLHQDVVGEAPFVDCPPQWWRLLLI